MDLATGCTIRITIFFLQWVQRRLLVARHWRGPSELNWVLVRGGRLTIIGSKGVMRFVVFEAPVLPFFLGNWVGEAVVASALEAPDSLAEVGLVKSGLLLKFELELAATTVRCGH